MKWLFSYNSFVKSHMEYMGATICPGYIQISVITRCVIKGLFLTHILCSIVGAGCSASFLMTLLKLFLSVMTCHMTSHLLMFLDTHIANNMDPFIVFSSMIEFSK